MWRDAQISLYRRGKKLYDLEYKDSYTQDHFFKNYESSNTSSTPTYTNAYVNENVKCGTYDVYVNGVDSGQKLAVDKFELTDQGLDWANRTNNTYFHSGYVCDTLYGEHAMNFFSKTTYTYLDGVLCNTMGTVTYRNNLGEVLLMLDSKTLGEHRYLAYETDDSIYRIYQGSEDAGRVIGNGKAGTVEEYSYISKEAEGNSKTGYKESQNVCFWTMRLKVNATTEHLMDGAVVNIKDRDGNIAGELLFKNKTVSGNGADVKWINNYEMYMLEDEKKNGSFPQYSVYVDGNGTSAAAPICVDFYTVTYQKNGASKGDGPRDSTIYLKGDTATVQGVNSLTWADHYFMGWKQKENGVEKSGIYQKNDTFRVEGKTELVAQWANTGEAPIRWIYTDIDEDGVAKRVTGYGTIRDLMNVCQDNPNTPMNAYINGTKKTVVTREGETIPSTVTFYIQDGNTLEIGAGTTFVNASKILIKGDGTHRYSENYCGFLEVKCKLNNNGSISNAGSIKTDYTTGKIANIKYEIDELDKEAAYAAIQKAFGGPVEISEDGGKTLITLIGSVNCYDTITFAGGGYVVDTCGFEIHGARGITTNADQTKTYGDGKAAIKLAGDGLELSIMNSKQGAKARMVELFRVEVELTTLQVQQNIPILLHIRAICMRRPVLV